MSTPLELARRIVGAVNFMDNPLMPDAKILAQALIEAAKDTERLDWIINNGANVMMCSDGTFDVFIVGDEGEPDYLHIGSGDSARAAIDAAKGKA